MENNKLYNVTNYVYKNFKQNIFFLILNIPLIVLSFNSNYSADSYIFFVLAGSLFLPALSLLMYSASIEEIKLKRFKANVKKYIKYIIRMWFIGLIFSSTIFFIFFFDELQKVFNPMIMMTISLLSIPILFILSSFSYFYSQNSEQPIIKILVYTVHMTIQRWYITIPLAVAVVVFAVFFIFNPVTFGLFLPYALSHLVTALHFIVIDKGSDLDH